MLPGLDPNLVAAIGAALQGSLPLAAPVPPPLSTGLLNGAWMVCREPGGECTARMSVEPDKVGSVLGKRGANATQIRQVRCHAGLPVAQYGMCATPAAGPHVHAGLDGWQRLSLARPS